MRFTKPWRTLTTPDDHENLSWEAGIPTELRGIAERDECAVAASIHEVELFIREAGCRVVIPFCFAEGDAPLLLGREGFFDVFRIEFDKHQSVTVFELNA